MTREQAAAAIAGQFSGAQVQAGASLVVTIAVDQWVAFARFAKETLGCRFFAFSTAVDWKEQGLEVVAKVDNLDDGLPVVMKTRLGAGVSSCPSLVPVYRGAGWMERECYDMFGIRFEGHPDLRRILLADDWVGHPLLKSYAVDTPHPPYR
ncbi:MAG TPA: NADH-quinone oxidoreductase subunit C [Vicinamibacterales bacterium]|nr:NADH-quinone oxidoreductase subunit C [Vicinamibacterales bacterium]